MSCILRTPLKISTSTTVYTYIYIYIYVHSMSLYIVALLFCLTIIDVYMLAMYENDICTNEIDLSGWEFTPRTMFTKTRMYVIMDIGLGGRRG